MKSLILALALAVDSPVEVPVTPGLSQSVAQYIALTAKVCQKLSITAKNCNKDSEKEMREVREYVDKVCSQIAPPNEQVPCIQEGLEAMLDRVLIPKKISILNSTSI